MDFYEFRKIYRESKEKGMIDQEIVVLARRSGMEGVEIVRYFRLIESGAGIPDFLRGKFVNFIFKMIFTFYGVLLIYGFCQIIVLTFFADIPLSLLLSSPKYEAHSPDFVSAMFFPLNFLWAHIYVFCLLGMSFIFWKMSQSIPRKLLFFLASVTLFVGGGLFFYFLYQTGFYPSVYILENIY